MARMLRKQIYIQKHQQVLLRRLAKARGVSEAELIRQAIDRQIIGGVTGSTLSDPAAWDKARRFMLALQAQGPLPNRPRRWTREIEEKRLLDAMLLAVPR